LAGRTKNFRNRRPTAVASTAMNGFDGVMCGRFTQRYTWEQLVRLYRLTQPARNLQPRHNIPPTTTIDAVVPRQDHRELLPMRWGLIPSWWKKSLKEVPATFNARAESVAEKPMFRTAFRKSRCIIPASGYYEWKAEEGGKQPHYITSADGAVLSIAGLWDEWRNPEGETVRNCTMIVTAANDALRSIHDRMPVFLAPDSFDAWLGGTVGTELLKPAPNDLLRSWPVSKRVNRPGNDEDATLTEPLHA
jgi:putative SOS response-associated peptidase YedK